ncbi:MAG: nucleotidyltransferase family protein [Alphaproteobacteria bacterium]|nr:nucleotidyltransferase family protein [Alphaproteobacteria bacterium]
MIRVLHVHCELEIQSSGVARHIDGLARALASGGEVEVECFVSRFTGGGKSLDYPVRTGGWAELARAVRDCDVVHAHGSRTLISAVALRMAWGLRKPSVFTPHCYYDGGPAWRRAGKWVWDRAVEQGSVALADGVIILHDGWKADLLARGFRPRRTATIPNCIDADHLARRMEASPPVRLSGSPALLSVGRVDRVKRLDDVILALARPELGAAELHIVGQGDDRPRLESLAAGHGLAARVHFLGWQDDARAASLMGGCDAMVLASEREGLPTVVLEALCAGVPIACSDIPGITAITRPVSWPYTFPLGEVDSLARCLADCARAPVPSHVRNEVERLFSWQGRSRDVLDVYRSLSAGGTGDFGFAGFDSPLEFETLIGAVRAARDPARKAWKPAGVASGGINWRTVLDGARVNHVSRSLLAGLQSLEGPPPPEDVVAALRRRIVADGRRCLVIASELVRLNALFQSAGLQVMVLKGVPLSRQIHDDIATRGAGDIDLIASAERMWEVDEVLVTAGYRRKASLMSDRHRAAYRLWAKEMGYRHPELGVYVELHWRLTKNPRLLHIDFGQLWDGRDSVGIGGAAIPAMSRGQLPVYLCVHGALHGWERLRWLLDLADLLEDAEEMDRAIEEARRLGLAPLMLEAIGLAGRWLGLEIPAPVRIQIAADPQVKRLDALRLRFMSGPAWYRRPGRFAYAVSLRKRRHALKPGWRYRTSEIVSDLACPSDWEAISLPAGMIWLYPFLRPWGWLVRLWQARKPESSG